MIPMELPDKAQIESEHLNAFSRGVYEKFNDLEEYVKNCKEYTEAVLVDLKMYLKVLSDASLCRILTMDVSAQRDLVASVDKILPSGRFFGKETRSVERNRAFADVNDRLLKVFDYDAFARMKGAWGLLELALRLNRTVKVCPYCNGEYVFAFKFDKGDFSSKAKGRKSPFDHYFPRSRYPFLGLSLYNLIPCCSRCNSLMKRDIYDGLINMPHPYEADVTDSVHKGMKFRVLASRPKAFSCCSIEDIDSVLFAERRNGTFPAGKHWERLFKINDVYSNIYLGRAADAMCKSVGYTASYFEELRGKLAETGLPVGDVERLVYGASLRWQDINRTPFAKMTIDVHDTYARC